MIENNISAPDLRQRPPRSARCRLGGYVLLPRMLDKGRASMLPGGCDALVAGGVRGASPRVL